MSFIQKGGLYFLLFFILSYFSVSPTMSPTPPRVKRKTFPNLFLLNFWVGMDDKNTTSQGVCCKPGFMKQVLVFSLGSWLKKNQRKTVHCGFSMEVFKIQ